MIRTTAFFALLLVGVSAVPETGRTAVDVPSLAAAAGRYVISNSSNIAFSVDQVGGGGIKGRFAKFSGSFNLKAGDLTHALVTFELKPDSVSTGQERVDSFLRSTAVFDAGHFDNISFRSEHIEQTGSDSARITGTLTAKGHSDTETFDVNLTSWNNRMIGFTVSGRIFRSHYAMDVGTPIFSNVVQFDMMIVGQRG
jgi:polyisoprenoid-binding protein YceI